MRKENQKPFYKKWWVWMFIILGIVGIAAEGNNGVTIVKDGVESLNPKRFGRYARTISGYESSITVIDDININSEIRTGLGWADRKGHYKVKDDEMYVTWDSVNTNMTDVSGNNNQTFKLGSGSSSSGGLSWYEINVGSTSYLKRQN